MIGEAGPGGDVEVTSPTAGSEADLDLSVVIPVYNEVDSVVPLADKVLAVLQRTGRSHEVVFVDDGSTDATRERLVALHGDRSEIKVIELRANFGKAAALQAGFTRARGRIIITMDGDLQDDPEEIPNFIKELEDKDLDLVSGWKLNRQDPLSKTLPSKLYNAVTARMSQLDLHDFNCGFKAYRREVVRQLNLYGELHRYIPVLAFYKGFRVGEIRVRHHPRRFGRSKYGLDRFWKGFVDLVTVLFLTKYTRRPLHLYGMMGLLTSVVGTGILGYLSLRWFQGYAIGDRPILFLGILLIIVGIQFFTTGLVAEMVTHIAARQPEDVHVRRVHS